MKRVHCVQLSLGCIGMLVGVAGCGGSTPSEDKGSGTLKLLITDKPFPIDLITSARITITRVEVRLQDEDVNENANLTGNINDNGSLSGRQRLQGDDNDNEETDNDNDSEDDDEDDDASFLTIFEGEREFDLLDLQNGRTDLLADAEISAGTYTQMRLVVTMGIVEITDGREFVLDVPSGAESGIKLNFTFDVEDGEETTLLLDVDLSRAFQPIPGGMIDDPGTITGFKFQPSLAMRLIDLVDAGSISGTVTDQDGTPIEDALLTAYDEDDTEVTSTSAECDGSYVLFGLATGTYRVEASASGFEDNSIEGVQVNAGEESSGVDVQLTPG